jgi:hypothetical protein
LDKERLVDNHSEHVRNITALQKSVHSLKTACNIGTDQYAELHPAIAERGAPLGNDKEQTCGISDIHNELRQTHAGANDSNMVLDSESATTRDINQYVAILENAVEDLNSTKEESNIERRLFGCFPLFCPVWKPQKNISLPATEDGRGYMA